jgi:asparagine synthase (glutamine-hydrolysing)
MADFLAGPGSVDDAFAALRGIFSRPEAAALTAWITGGPAPLPEAVEQDAAEGGTLDRISALELTRYMRNQLLRDSDVMSMAHGLELRVPLVDRVLVERVTQVSAAQRLRPNKGLFTAAVPEVPDWVVNQRKRGFLFPYQKWLGGEWGDAFAGACAQSPVAVPQWYQKWSLFMLRHSLEVLGLRS